MTAARVALPSRRWRSNTCFEPLLLDQAEGRVEGLHQPPDRRRERAIGRILLLGRPPSAANRSSTGRPGRSAARARAAWPGLAKPSPGGDMSAFCDPDTTTSRPVVVLADRHGTRRRDRVHGNQGVMRRGRPPRRHARR